MAVLLFSAEAAFSTLYPTDLEFAVNAPNDMSELTIIQVVAYAFNATRMVALLAFCYFSNDLHEKAKQDNLTRARYVGEVWCYLGSITTMVSIVGMHYRSMPAAAEEWFIICLKNCVRTIVFAWAELHPIGAALTLIPLWCALLLIPDATSASVATIGVGTVVRFSIGTLGAFMGLVAIMIYKNNRQMFVNQVHDRLDCIFLNELTYVNE